MNVDFILRVEDYDGSSRNPRFLPTSLYHVISQQAVTLIFTTLITPRFIKKFTLFTEEA